MAFGFDMVTPQALVAAILLTVPIALSSVLLNRRMTAGFVVAALIANAFAGWYNGPPQGHHWDTIAIGNRALAAFSIVLVAILGGLAQTAAERAGSAAAQQRQADRAQALRRAMEAIRSSLNVELVARAIVREAMDVFSVSGARLYLIEHAVLAASTYRYDPLQNEVLVHRERPAPELLSLIQRALVDRRVVSIDRSDALSRFGLDTLEAHRAFLVPLSNEQITFGVLLLTFETGDPVDPDIERWLAIFAEQATVAAAQAYLFVELADKNNELSQAIATLEHRGEVIRDLVYALSHDLRTPLAAAAMTTQQALDGLHGALPESYRELLRRSIASNDELRRLAETLLLVARYESGEESSVREPVAMGSVAESVVRELESLWQSKHISCEMKTDARATVLGDESELRRAVMNLVANAINWTPEGGVIVVSVERSGDQVALTINDTGYGVPSEQREHLFERLTSARSRRGSGSGLGLYIVRRIAESHGGRARHQPRDPRGSAFILELPLAREPQGDDVDALADSYVPHRSR